MTVLRFFLYLFVLICVLAGSGLVVAAFCLMLRFPPLFIAVGLGCGLFAVVLAKTSRT
ncbi:hypothetical protein PS870_05769 [Pseudomonas fluorescens]|uniref:Uncharacterized protein n=1 Tax=Pseudomonas fluorescens TaxID=294 RepID=A0A5E7Q5F4_PSEFL|nr:hypothetical protein [Pseudomonas fluorescens]VVP57356.1 hypothetical protein PS870_05769 [Pseudomonas fluorescens]